MAEVSDVVAAVDVGGTRIKAALVTAAYDTLAAVMTPTPKDIAADIGAVVHATVTDLLATAAEHDRPARLVGCGVVVPGLVDETRGVGAVLGEPRLAGPADPRPGGVPARRTDRRRA